MNTAPEPDPLHQAEVTHARRRVAIKHARAHIARGTEHDHGVAASLLRSAWSEYARVTLASRYELDRYDDLDAEIVALSALFCAAVVPQDLVRARASYELMLYDRTWDLKDMEVHTYGAGVVLRHFRAPALTRAVIAVPSPCGGDWACVIWRDRPLGVMPGREYIDAYLRAASHSTTA